MNRNTRRTGVAALPDIIENAYRLFQHYRPQSPLNVCHCDVCISAENEAKLLSTPLRQISSKLLAAYSDAVSAGTEPARFDELRYFLPRYFDVIAANDPPDNMGLDICLRRLHEPQWRKTWSADQVALIEDFFDAYLLSSLAKVELCEWPAGWFLRHGLDRVLTMIVTAGGDVERALEVWNTAPDPAAAIHMASLRRTVSGGPPSSLTNAHLSGEFEAAAYAIGEFLSREEVNHRLESAFFLIDDERLQKIVSDAMWI
jgi:hypothetical protein